MWPASLLTTWSRLATLAAVVIVVGLGTGGCGYRQSGSRSGSLWRGDIRSVAVPTATNKSFVQGIEFSLSKALINQLEVASPYKVCSRENADSILECEIVAANIVTLSHDPHTAVAQDQVARITVNFVWKDLRSGRILVQRKDFAQIGPYYPTLGESRFVGSQQTVERMAVAMVQQLQADW